MIRHCSLEGRVENLVEKKARLGEEWKNGSELFEKLLRSVGRKKTPLSIDRRIFGLPRLVEIELISIDGQRSQNIKLLRSNKAALRSIEKERRHCLKRIDALEERMGQGRIVFWAAVSGIASGLVIAGSVLVYHVVS